MCNPFRPMLIFLHEGYTGQAQWDNDIEMWVGHVTGIQDAITFQGHSREAAENAFRDSIEDYRDFTRELEEDKDDTTDNEEG